MVADSVAVSIVVLACIAFAYHHFIYPVALKWLATRRRWTGSTASALVSPDAPAQPPSITIVVPAYNEDRFIAEKVRNLAALEYPRDRLTIVIALDGCTDATEATARAALDELDRPEHIQIAAFARNRGKLAVINEQIERAQTDVVALSDVSAMLNSDALLRSARHFADAGVGVVCATYRLSKPRSAGEATYWAYQTRLKADEARLAAPMGAHGAFYLFRRSAWEPLPADTINDDFILPMRIVAKGLRAIYDESVVAMELEETKAGQEFWRRIRIGAGNMQQVVRLASLGRPSNGWLAFVFLSGKGLRPLIAPLVLAAMVAMAYLSWRGYLVCQLGLLACIAALAVATDAIVRQPKGMPKIVSWLAYLVEGHAASLVGSVRYLTNHKDLAWSQAEGRDALDPDYAPWSVRAGKRALDIACALATLAFLAIIFIPIAIAIKLDSRGPIFYRQQRVGYCRPNVTRLIKVVKFRTMRQDAEALSGAVWASKNDPRITRVGWFLRKTRIDELPQVFNVLAGEMSFVGPRPERPSLVANLEAQIPFYLERNFYMLPGITGLAQINQGYDDTIDDVRRKVMFDHAYAARLATFKSWLLADLGILFGTLKVMILGRGR